jgi:hypothetical protein
MDSQNEQTYMPRAVITDDLVGKEAELCLYGNGCELFKGREIRFDAYGPSKRQYEAWFIPKSAKIPPTNDFRQVATGNPETLESTLNSIANGPNSPEVIRVISEQNGYAIYTR